MSKQDPQFTDEMISAYLDGELSDSEREYVERVVESEPQYQRMLEELQALRHSLKSLPQFRLDGEFHQRVLDRAVEQSQPRIEQAAHAGDRQIWRRMAWVAGTIAAGVLFMLFVPGWLRMFDMGPPGELGQLPRTSGNAPQIVEPNADVARDDSSDRLHSDDAPADGAMPSDPLPELSSNSLAQGKSDPAKGVRQPYTEDAGTVMRREAINPTGAENAAAIVDDVDHDVVQPGADLDAVIYVATRSAVDSRDRLRLQSVYRARGVTSEPLGVELESSEFGVALANQPRFIIVTGTAEQIVTSLNQIESSIGSGMDRAAAGEFDAEDAFRENSLAESYAAKSHDQLIRSSDLFIDLDAADTNPAVVEPVAEESDEHQRLMGLLATKSRRRLQETVDHVEAAPVAEALSEQMDRRDMPMPKEEAEDGAEDETKGLADETRAVAPVPTRMKRSPSAARLAVSPSPAAPSPAAPSAAAPRSPTARRGGLATEGESHAVDRETSLAFGRAPVSFYYQRGQNPRKTSLYDAGPFVGELKRISPRNENGTLRVLFVLPTKEATASEISLPAQEAK